LPRTVRVKKRGPEIPHSVVDGIIDLHAAVDPDTGHFICHYLAVRPEIIELQGEDYPGLGLGDGLTVLVGEGPAGSIEEAGEPVDLALLASGEEGKGLDRASLGLVFSFYRYHQGRIRAYRLEGAYAVVVRPDRGEPVAVLLWPVRKKAGGGAVLTV